MTPKLKEERFHMQRFSCLECVSQPLLPYLRLCNSRGTRHPNFNSDHRNKDCHRRQKWNQWTNQVLSGTNLWYSTGLVVGAELIGLPEVGVEIPICIVRKTRFLTCFACLLYNDPVACSSNAPTPGWISKPNFGNQVVCFRFQENWVHWRHGDVVNPNCSNTWHVQCMASLVDAINW